MRKSKLLLLCRALAFLLALQTTARAAPGFDLGIMAGSIQSTYKSTYVLGTSNTGHDSLVFGATADIGNLNASLLLARHNWETATSLQTYTSTTQFLELPVLLRVLSFGNASLRLGGYFGKFLSTDSTGPSIAPGKDVYGATSSLRIQFPVEGLFLDLRGNLQLRGTDDTRYHSFQGMLGWLFF